LDYSWEHSILSSPEEALLKIINQIIDELLESDANLDRTKKIKEGAEKIFKGALRLGVSAVGGASASEIAKELLHSSGPNITKLRGQLNDVAEEITSRKSNLFKKIIIYVDDLDRIEPKNAVAILELLKNIFSVPHCVFILAIDYQVVVKGLEHKFGKQTEKNEWEFRAFFDKIIQLPFMMPIGQYNIGKYVNHLLTQVGFVDEKDRLDPHAVAEIMLRSIGSNPRSIKRLVNNISLIQIITEENSENGQTEDDEDKKMGPETEKILIFSLLCLQIAYPPIYSLLTKNPDFESWDEDFARAETKLKEEDTEGVFKKDFKVAITSKDFDEEWEQALFRLCYLRPPIQKRVEDISKLFSYIKDELMKDNQENIGDSIEYILSQTSVTSVASTDQGQDQPKKKFSVENLTVKDTVNFTFNKKNYTLTIFKEKGALRLYDENKKEMKARKVFAEIIKKENLDITVNHTRQMGPKILKYYKEKIGR
jgi:hypothetical protein